MDNQILKDRAIRYANAKGIQVDWDDTLGHGTDGNVWFTSEQSVIKVFRRDPPYWLEVACYELLRDKRITQINGLRIPEFLGHDDKLKIVEIGYVTPPCMFDFGKAYLDHHPYENDADFMARAEAEDRELWGDFYPRIQSIVWELRQIGIAYLDARPSNIMFTDWDPEI